MEEHHEKTVPVVARGTKEPHASLRNNNFPPLPVCAAGWQIVTVSTTETPGGVGYLNVATNNKQQIRRTLMRLVHKIRCWIYRKPLHKKAVK